MAKARAECLGKLGTVVSRNDCEEIIKIEGSLGDGLVCCSKKKEETKSSESKEADVVGTSSI